MVDQRGFLMIRIKKRLLISVICFCFYANQSVSFFGIPLERAERAQVQEQKKEMVGSLAIVPDSLIYSTQSSESAGCTQKEWLENALSCKLQDNDPLVRVLAANEDCGDWSGGDCGVFRKRLKPFVKLLNLLRKKKRPEHHGGFPSYLPLSLIDEKREGDNIKLTVWGIPVTLTCSQLSSRPAKNRKGKADSFEVVLAEQKQRFAMSPHFKYTRANIRTLEDNGILALDRSVYIHRHGPNGYRVSKEY